MSEQQCDACGTPTTEALARTVRLSVDRATIDTQVLCPDCFADWIEQYEQDMAAENAADGPDSEIIVD